MTKRATTPPTRSSRAPAAASFPHTRAAAGISSDAPLDLVELVDGAIVGTSHRRRMEALLLHFHRGVTLAECADRRRLNRKVATLKPYVRRLKIAFADYVPRALRPKKVQA
jgi:hypothetical protein